MPTATVTVQYVNPPKEGRQTGSIKTREGAYYDVWPDKLAQFQPNTIYEVEYTERDYNGKTYRTIQKIVGDKGAAPGSARGGGGRNSYRETSAADAERMFVCSMVNGMIHGGHVGWDRDHILRLVNDMRWVWTESFGKAPGQSAPAVAAPVSPPNPAGAANQYQNPRMGASAQTAEILIKTLRLSKTPDDLYEWFQQESTKAALARLTEADKQTVRDEYALRQKALKSAENVSA